MIGPLTILTKMASSQEGQSWSGRREALEQDLRDWWDRRQGEWEADVEEGAQEDDELWRDMPEIDSKEVATTKPTFEEHLDVDFDPSMIRPGGYVSIKDMINHIVPQMMEKARSSRE